MICRRVSDKSLLRLSTGGRAQYRCRGPRHLAAHPRRPGHHERALVVLVCSRAPEFKAFLQRACDIGRRRPDLARCHYQGVCAHARPRTRSSAQAQPRNAEGRHLRDAVIVEARDKLLVFLTRRDVEPTSNESERNLRPSVIFRKVTNGFRSDWGAKVYADLCSIVGTARLNGRSSFAAIRAALTMRSKLATSS